MVQAQFVLAVNFGLLDVHVQAESTPVHLRSPNGDDVTDGFFDGAFSRRVEKLREFSEKIR
jgi:hypothetical protein